MTVSRDCGKCNEPISLDEKTVEDFDIPVSCPHCGEKTPKRDGGAREKKVLTGRMAFDGKKKEFVTVDVSAGGVKAFYLGRALPKDAIVTVDIDGMSIHERKATVAWSHKAASAYSHSGFKFV